MTTLKTLNFHQLLTVIAFACVIAVKSVHATDIFSTINSQINGSQTVELTEKNKKKIIEKWLKNSLSSDLPQNLAQTLDRVHFKYYEGDADLNGKHNLAFRHNCTVIDYNTNDDRHEHSPSLWSVKILINTQCIDQTNYSYFDQTNFSEIKENINLTNINKMQLWKDLWFNLVELWVYSNDTFNDIDQQTYILRTDLLGLGDMNFIHKNYSLDIFEKIFEEHTYIDVHQNPKYILENFWKITTFLYRFDPKLNYLNQKLHTFVRSEFFGNKTYKYESAAQNIINATTEENLSSLVNSNSVNRLFVRDYHDYWKVSYDARARYLEKNSDSWWTRYELINMAKENITVNYFIFAADLTGITFMNLLKRKALEGVKIKILVDAKGTSQFAYSKVFKMMKYLAQFGVEIRYYNPISVFNFPLNYFANTHQKILIVDDQYVVIGGRNIQNAYLVDHSDISTAFYDCDTVIDSPEVARITAMMFGQEFFNRHSLYVGKMSFFKPDNAKMEMLFDEATAITSNFMFVKDEREGTIDSAAENKRLKSNELSKTLFSLYRDKNHPFDLWENSVMTKVKIISTLSPVAKYTRGEIIEYLNYKAETTEKEVVMLNPYLHKTAKINHFFKVLGDKNIPMVLGTNSRLSNDIKFLPKFTYYWAWDGYLKRNPKLRLFGERGPSILHAKTFVFDELTTLVGSYNLNMQSEWFSSELMLEVESAEFSKRVKNVLIKHIQDTSFPYYYKQKSMDTEIANVVPTDCQLDPMCAI